MSKTLAVRKLGALVPMAALLLASSHMASAQHVQLAFKLNQFVQEILTPCNPLFDITPDGCGLVFEYCRLCLVDKQDCLTTFQAG